MNRKDIVIIGAGGFAREVAWLIQSCNQNNNSYNIICFVDDTKELYGQILNDIPVLNLDEVSDKYPHASIVVALGNPKSREIEVRKAEERGFIFETIIHPKIEMSSWVDVGLGTIICAGNIITTNIKIGKHVHINLDCTIGHDVIMDDFATLAPGVHVSGRVHIGKRVYIGTGAEIINGSWRSPLIIEDDVIIGAGACVINSLPANQTYVGVPAKSKTNKNSS